MIFLNNDTNIILKIGGAKAFFYRKSPVAPPLANGVIYR